MSAQFLTDTGRRLAEATIEHPSGPYLRVILPQPDSGYSSLALTANLYYNLKLVLDRHLTIQVRVDDEAQGIRIETNTALTLGDLASEIRGAYDDPTSRTENVYDAGDQ